MRPTGIDVAVNGGTLAAWRLAEGSGDPVVAIHGITSTSRAWLAVARCLDGRAGLAALDLRGRGASSGLPGPYGLDAHAEDVIAVLDALGLPHAVLAGHSLGAWIACRVATRHSDRVSRLVLVDGGLPAPGAGELSDADADAAITATLGPAIERLQTRFADRAAYREWWAAHPAFVGSDVDPEILGALSDWDLGGESPLLHSTVAPDAVRRDGRDLLSARDGETIDTPAVLLHVLSGLDGAPPPLLDPGRVADWAGARPGRRAVLVPDANHYTIAIGESGARVVADEIVAALGGSGSGGPALA